jgi:hypothetical protein
MGVDFLFRIVRAFFLLVLVLSSVCEFFPAFQIGEAAECDSVPAVTEAVDMRAHSPPL